MTNVFRIREIQLGLIILFSFYFFSLFSGLDLHMILTHQIVLGVTCCILIVLMLNLRIMTQAPHRGLLRLTHKQDTWFITAYQMMYFILFFTVCTIISSLINYSLYLDRSQNIFTLGMFIANIYYLIIALWSSCNFVIMSTKGDNMEFERE